jgi:hypothetical protein
MECAGENHDAKVFFRRYGVLPTLRTRSKETKMPARAPRFTVKPTLLAILLAFPAQQALATACTWNPASGNWATAGNWSCAIVPGINDDALIAAGNAVTIDAAQAVRNLNNGAASISMHSSSP